MSKARLIGRCMPGFDIPLEKYLSAPVCTVKPSDTLPFVRERLIRLGFSSLAVIGENSAILGMISRTDLLRIGNLSSAPNKSDAVLLSLPDTPVSHSMTSQVVTVSPNDSIRNAAREMLKRHIHRVFVERDDKLIGVLSSLDMMLAVRDNRVETPISELASTPVITVHIDDPVSWAIERLETSRVTGLVVLDERWPVGLFTQLEALRSRDLPPDTKLEDCMSTAILIMDSQTPLYRAAAQASELKSRCVVAMRDEQMTGILTGLDFVSAAI